MNINFYGQVILINKEKNYFIFKIDNTINEENVNKFKNLNDRIMIKFADYDIKNNAIEKTCKNNNYEMFEIKINYINKEMINLLINLNISDILTMEDNDIDKLLGKIINIKVKSDIYNFTTKNNETIAGYKLILTN